MAWTKGRRGWGRRRGLRDVRRSRGGTRVGILRACREGRCGKVGRGQKVELEEFRHLSGQTRNAAQWKQCLGVIKLHIRRCIHD